MLKKVRKSRAIAGLSIGLLVLQLVVGALPTRVSAASVTSASDTMTRHQVSTASDHTITFTTPTGVDASTDTITLTFQSGFDLTSLVPADVTLSGGFTHTTVAATAGAGTWGFAVSGQVATLTAPTDAGANEVAAGASVTIALGTHITNPTSTGSYEIAIGGTFGDSGEIDVPIVDSDQVAVSAQVDTFINFDLDVSEGHGDSNASGGTYSLDLGELTFSALTDEADVEEIYVDLDTNADDGAVVQVLSANGANGLSSSSSSDKIPSTSTTLTTGTTNGGWGLAADEQATATEGTLTPVSPFNVVATTGGVGGLTTSFQTIFNTGTAPIVGGSGVVNVRAVAGTSTSAADDYTDTLTFRATATY